MKDTANSFGANLKALRKKAGLTQPELAYLIGVHETTIRAWELDDRLPKSGYIKRLAEALGVSEQQLLAPDTRPSGWVLTIKVAQDFREGVIDLSKGTPNVSDLNLHKDGATLVLSAPFEMWTNEENLEDLYRQLKESIGLIIYNGKKMGNIKQEAKK